MAPALGKRKPRYQFADVDLIHEPTADANHANLQALFQQHFESTFEPLPGSLARPPLVDSVDTRPSDEEFESDWDGFSDHSEEYAETVHCATSAPSKADITKDELKTFMVRVQLVNAPPILN